MAASTMSLRNSIRFQKALALAAVASNEFEATAAELAVRRLMEACNIDPTRIPNGSLYGRMSFADNPLLKKLRDEWREQHPVAAPVMEEDEKRTSLGFSWSSKEYVKVANQKRAKRTRDRSRSSGSRDETRVEKLRLLLNSGKSRSAIIAEDGFTWGEISGIIRDYTGSESAHSRFQSRPKWVAMPNGRRTIYMLSMTREPNDSEADSPEAIDSAGDARSGQDVEPDCQCGEAREPMPPSP